MAVTCGDGYFSALPGIPSHGDSWGGRLQLTLAAQPNYEYYNAFNLNVRLF